METVIAGVDGSETALEAARAAADLAKRLGAQLHLVMAISPHKQQQTVRGGGGESWTINTFNSAEQKLISEHYHQQLAHALSARDADRAELIMKEHVFEARDFLIENLKESE